MTFQDRHEAGQLLAERLERDADDSMVVLALPRGGVVVGYEVAMALGAPLDVLVVRKLGVPWRPELGMGAIAEGGAVYLNREVLRLGDLHEGEVQAVAASEAREVERRVMRYRGLRPLPEVRGRTVLLVDDGVATGGTAHAAILALREKGPRKLILAFPVGAAQTVAALRREVDAVICLEEPSDLWALSAWYDDFHAVSDEEVLTLLAHARQATLAPAALPPTPE